MIRSRENIGDRVSVVVNVGNRAMARAGSGLIYCFAKGYIGLELGKGYGLMSSDKGSRLRLGLR